MSRVMEIGLGISRFGPEADIGSAGPLMEVSKQALSRTTPSGRQAPIQADQGYIRLPAR